MNRTLIFLSCCLLLGLSAQAQISRRDSLRRVLRLMRPQEAASFKVAALLAETFRFQQPDSAIKYARQSLSGPEIQTLFPYKASAHNTLGYAHYQTGNYKAALASFHSYYAYAAKTRDKVAMAYALNNEGNVYIDLGDYSSALDKYKQALALRQSIGDRKGIAMSYNNIGYIYKDLGDYEDAVRHMLYGLREMEALGDKALIASSCNMLGAVFLRKKDYEQTLAYQERALKLQREIQDKNGEAISLQMIANAYGMQGNFPAALRASEKALPILKASSDRRQLCILHANIGELYARQQDYRASVPCYDSAIQTATRIGYRRGLAGFWLGQAQNFIELNRLPETRRLLDSARVQIAETHNKEQQASLYDLESRYHAALGAYSQALAFARLFAAQKDSLLNEDNLKAMSDMSVKYETEKKQATIAKLDKESALQQLQINEQNLRHTQDRLALSEADLQITHNTLKIRAQNNLILKQELEASLHAHRMDSLSRKAQLQGLELTNRNLQLRQRNAALGSLALLLLLGGFLGYSYYRRAQLKAASRMQQALLQQQEINTRSILEAEEAERVRIAQDLHDGIGQLMSAARMNLSAFEHDFNSRSPEESESYARVLSLVDQSCNELRSVSHNMMPNALLKNNLAAAVRAFIAQIDRRKLAVHLNTEGLDQRLDPNLETVLYRVIQECVNNVIKHSGADTLDISLYRDAAGITASIEDNGCGFEPEGIRKHEGIGLKNIRARMAYLKGNLDIDSAPGRGTVVLLQVPFSAPATQA